MDIVFFLLQLLAIPVIAIAMFVVPWIKLFYRRFGEVKSVVLLAGILLVLHVVGIFVAGLTNEPNAALATFFSGIASFVLFALALIPAKIAKSRHQKLSK